MGSAQAMKKAPALAAEGQANSPAAGRLRRHHWSRSNHLVAPLRANRTRAMLALSGDMPRKLQAPISAKPPT